jgi:hypothetical protein
MIRLAGYSSGPLRLASLKDTHAREESKMRKLRTFLSILSLLSLSAMTVFASANFVYHERSSNSVSGSTATNGACPSGGMDASHPVYTEVMTPTSQQPDIIRFKVECQFFTDSLAVLYTTNGTAPTGNFTTSGADQVLVPTGTTQIVRFVGTRPDLQVGNISYECTFNDPLTPCGSGSPVDIVSASIPPQPAGTNVTYVVAAWHHGGGNITFADSGNCGSCFNCNNTGCAAQFAYTVLSPTAADGTIAGQVTTDGGIPVAGATLMLSGSKSDATITDASGKYQFDGLETSGFYTITPLRSNYNFSPSNMVLTLFSRRADASFSAVAVPETANPLDTTDFFVRQQYIDFLNREPDRGGLAYWTNQINLCNGEEACVHQKRVAVSAAFFVEREFQQTGSFIYGLYKASLGRMPSYAEFMPDRNNLSVDSNLESSKAQLAESFVHRAEFMLKYPQSLGRAEFVDALLRNVRENSGVNLNGMRAGLLSDYEANGDRARLLRAVAENQSFAAAEYNRAFVSSEYFSYLRRDPDIAGLDFWLNVLDNKEPGNYIGMVCSFITSSEYQERFSRVVEHSNRECGR